MGRPRESVRVNVGLCLGLSVAVAAWQPGTQGPCGLWCVTPPSLTLSSPTTPTLPMHAHTHARTRHKRSVEAGVQVAEARKVPQHLRQRLRLVAPAPRPRVQQG